MASSFESSFDRASDRLAWSATKWEKYRGKDVIPLWIADMDFPAAPAIQAAIARHVAHGNYGYMSPPRALAQQLVRHYRERHGWQIEEDWIVWLPGLVLGINLAVKAACQPGQSALAMLPSYPPFLNAPGEQGRELVPVKFVPRPGSPLVYDIDFETLEAAITPSTRLLQLCHPHNPLGRCYTRAELDRLADICFRHDLTVMSDEVHSDLVLDGDAQHVPFARALAERHPDMLGHSITLSGPGKTYNLAGIGIAWAIIPGPVLRTRFTDAMQGLVPDPSCFGYSALAAAFSDAEDWRQQTLATLRENRDLVSRRLDEMGLPHTHPEATYLTWIDAHRLAPKVGRVQPWFEQHGVGLSDGAAFGQPGFLRLNFACPRALLEEALERMARAVAAAHAKAA